MVARPKQNFVKLCSDRKAPNDRKPLKEKNNIDYFPLLENIWINFNIGVKNGYISFSVRINNSRPCRDMNLGLPWYYADMIPTELSWFRCLLVSFGQTVVGHSFFSAFWQFLFGNGLDRSFYYKIDAPSFQIFTLFKVGYSDTNCVCVCLLTDCSPPFEVRVYTNAVPDNAIATIANTAYSRGKQALGPIV